jgi:hypothetical protein
MIKTGERFGSARSSAVNRTASEKAPDPNGTTLSEKWLSSSRTRGPIGRRTKQKRRMGSRFRGNDSSAGL